MVITVVYRRYVFINLYRLSFVLVNVFWKSSYPVAVMMYNNEEKDNSYFLYVTCQLLSM